MRVMVDTNILFSAILFPDSTPARALQQLCDTNSLVLCDYVINELYEAISAKRPDLLADAQLLIAELDYELVCAAQSTQGLITDPKDSPILNAAIAADVDIIISGDKHFLSLDLEKPKTMRAAEYLEHTKAED